MRNLKEYQKNYRLLNKERLAEHDRLYYLANRENIIKRVQERYRLNSEPKKEYARNYYFKNKKRLTLVNNLWREKNKEKMRIVHAEVMTRRRARLNNLPVEKYKRTDIYKRFGGICIVCDEPISLNVLFPSPLSFTIPHIIPISKGGGDTVGNVAPAHFTCNLKIHNKVPIAVKPRVLNV